MRVLASLLIFCLCCMANIRQEIADAIKIAAEESGIDERIYYTIISVESRFEPYSIGLIADKKLVKRLEDLKEYFLIKKTVLGKKYLVSIVTDSEDNIIKLAKALYPMNVNIDLGLMQISKQHIGIDEIEAIFKPKYNVAKATKILDECAQKFKTAKHAIECYNKGYSIKNFNYYDKFLAHYKRYFWEQDI